ncbi:hypothetical protein Zmor_025721 [Zophobas morio]|uniref:Uncharacterized protein n=1 Tax=Zophobas morio TaxID=2755281 RepID=A0AA38HTV4_9CUCU|nr:hypothetical protein Zmor_025721 [Zophobas morio]
MNLKLTIFFMVCVGVGSGEECCDEGNELEVREDSWGIFPKQWSLQNRIPMTTDFDVARTRDSRGKFKVKKKIKRFLLPLLLAYKLKFFTLIPVLIGGLILLTGATGLAGFFFALFAAVMGLKAGNSH